MDALFLFAPKFREFGVDVARSWASLQPRPASVRVHGLCTGNESTLNRVKVGLGSLAGRFEHLPALEQEFLRSSPTAAALAAFNSRYPAGTLGRTIAADRRIGRGYVCNGSSRPDLIADTVMRAPETKPEAYVVSLYNFLEDLMDALTPQVVFCYTVAGAPAFALSQICALRQITFLQLVPTRVGARYAVDTDSRGLLQATARRYKSGVASEQKKEAQEFLSAFRARPTAPEYMDTLAKRRATTHNWGRIASLIRRSAQRSLRAWVTGSDENMEQARRDFYEAMTIVRHKQAELQERRRNTVLPERFVYYPLHVSPEASTMVLAPDYTDQIPVIEALSKAMPAGVSLVVKEHVPMLGLRPRGFYERIEKLHRVRLVSAYVPSLTLIQKAEVVAVITGTAAWEAFLLGRPSISLAEMQFHCVPEAGEVVEGLKSLPQAVQKALQMKSVGQTELVRYLSALMDTSYDMPGHILWGNYGAADESDRVRVCSDIARHMQARIDELRTEPVSLDA